MDLEGLIKKKFLGIIKLKLPVGQYAITGSGPIGIRNIRDINDIDIIVSKKLWNKLTKDYDVIETNGVRKIELSSEIEAFSEESFQHKKDLTITERIRQAEIIQGLAFESLEHCKYFKKCMGREKDLKDIQMIEDWQNSHSESKDLKVKYINSEDAENLCREISSDLPEYFGLPEANENYAITVRNNVNFAIEYMNNFIGLLSLSFPYPKNANIYWMGILRNFQGNGYGSILIKEASCFAKNQGAETITVETLAPF